MSVHIFFSIFQYFSVRFILSIFQYDILQYSTENILKNTESHTEKPVSINFQYTEVLKNTGKY